MPAVEECAGLRIYGIKAHARDAARTLRRESDIGRPRARGIQIGNGNANR